MGELLRDLKSRVEAFADYHPDLVGTGIIVELTMFDENRQSGTAGFLVGNGPSKTEEEGLAFAKLRQAVTELAVTKGPEPPILQLQLLIDKLISEYESRARG